MAGARNCLTTDSTSILINTSGTSDYDQDVQAEVERTWQQCQFEANLLQQFPSQSPKVYVSYIRFIVKLLFFMQQLYISYCLVWFSHRSQLVRAGKRHVLAKIACFVCHKYSGRCHKSALKTQDFGATNTAWNLENSVAPANVEKPWTAITGLAAFELNSPQSPSLPDIMVRS